MTGRTTIAFPLALIVTVCILCGGTSTATAGPASSLPTFNLAQIPEADLTQGAWSDPQTEGDIRYRAALKQKQAQFNVNAWWDTASLRPPEGTIYILQVQYKDTVSTPAVFTAHGAIGNYHAQSEMHRFGGEGDGKWKIAHVPVSWDYLIRLLRERDKTAFGVRAAADLPIATITMRPATEQDEQRHNAETRAWVRKVQQAKRKQNPTGVVGRQFLKDKQLGPMVAFACPAMVPVPPNVQPTDEQVGDAVRIRTCLNELEPGSFGIYANGQDLTGVDYAVSELIGEAGTLNAEIIRRTAEYALVSKGGRQQGFRLFPQRLWPAFKTDIPKGHSQWFLFNVRTRRGQSSPGLYEGKITITSDQGSATLPLQVEVLPIDLLTMDEADLAMGGCLGGFVPQHDIAFQADYNQNATNIWFAGAQPGMTRKSGKLELDFTYLDDWMKGAAKAGCRKIVWFLGGNPYGWPDTMTIFRDFARMDTSRSENMNVRIAWTKKQAAEENRNSILPEIRPLFIDWVRQVAAHAKQAGWPEIILTPFDEPAKWVQGPYRKESDFPGAIGTGPWIKPFFKDACAAIREAAPDIRIYGSIHHNRTEQQEGICFLEDIDVFCTNAIHEDPKLGDKVRAVGKDFWQYSGTGGAAGDPNRARYTFGWYFAAFDSRGSLAWAYNRQSNFDTTRGTNWVYGWQTPFDTIPAPFFEGMREAWDNRRLIETYKKRLASDAQAMALLDDILKTAATSRGRGGRDTVHDFWAAIDDVKKLDNWRDQLLDQLAAQAK